MPGPELRPTRRAQTNGISKQRKNKNSSNLKRQLITITAVINNSSAQNRGVEDCLTISRHCSASPAPRLPVQHALNRACPPPQVVLFFDHINGNSPTQRSHEEAARYCRSLGHDMSIARTKLQALLISKDAVGRIADHATRWMTIYHGLYSLTYTFRTGFQLVATRDRMQSPDVHPVLLATYVLCLAISLQQAPSQTMIGDLSRSDYVLQVCDVIEEVIVRKNVLAGTVEGLETCMLLLMLAVGRNDLTTICLTLKRLVALADLMGLPQAGYARATGQGPLKEDPYHQAKLRIWEAICAIDRNFGMMLKLQACTTNSIFPLHKLVWRESGDISQSYNYFLARACGMTIAIDKSYSNDAPEADSFKMVTAVDQTMKSLASHVPKTWLTSNTGKAADLIVKFWHFYIGMRAHLRPAMILKEEYNNSRDVVRTNCSDALRMFCGLRDTLSRGFFYCRVLDIQAFTCAVLILLLREEGNTALTFQQNDLINRVIGCFQLAAAEGASSFARKAVQLLSSLQDFIRGCRTSTMTIHIPLLGNIKVENQDTPPTSGSLDFKYGFFPGEDGANSSEELFATSENNPLPSKGGISFSIDFENDSPWTPPASRAGGYGRD